MKNLRLRKEVKEWLVAIVEAPFAIAFIYAIYCLMYIAIGWWLLVGKKVYKKMKPLTKSGGLVDEFKVNVVFELEKEKAFRNTEIMRKTFKEKYNLNYWECGEVNKLITIYQVKKYGSNLAGAFIEEKDIKRTDNIYKKKFRRW